MKALHNPKIQSTQLLMVFNTSETELLNELLKKLKTEKFISVGTNLNNKVDQMTCKNSCLFVVLPEAKLLSFMTVVYVYLMNTKLSGFSVKNCITKKQSYTKLHNDIKNFSVYISGKCKNTCAKFAESGNKAIALTKTKLETAKSKEIPDIEVSGTVAPYYKEFNVVGGSDLAKLYFVIFCQQFDFYFDKNKLVTSDNVREEMDFYLKENPSSYRSVIVTFLKQCGAPISDDIIKRLNIIIEMISILHGIKYIPFKSGDDIVNPVALREIKNFVIEKH